MPDADPEKRKESNRNYMRELSRRDTRRER